METFSVDKEVHTVRQLLDEILVLACDGNENQVQKKRLTDHRVINANTVTDVENYMYITKLDFFKETLIQNESNSNSCDKDLIQFVTDSSSDDSDQNSCFATPIVHSSDSSPSMCMSHQDLDSMFESSLSSNLMYDSDNESITAALEQESMSCFLDDDDDDFSDRVVPHQTWKDIQTKETCLNSESSTTDHSIIYCTSYGSKCFFISLCLS